MRKSVAMFLFVSSVVALPVCCSADVQRWAAPRIGLSVGECITEAGRVGVIDHQTAGQWRNDFQRWMEPSQETTNAGR